MIICAFSQRFFSFHSILIDTTILIKVTVNPVFQGDIFKMAMDLISFQLLRISFFRVTKQRERKKEKMAGRIIFVRVLDTYSLLCVSFWCVFTLSLHSITDYDSLFWFHVRQKDLKEEKRGQNEWRMKLCMIYPCFQIKSWLSWVNDCWRVRKQDRMRDKSGKMRRKRLWKRTTIGDLIQHFVVLEDSLDSFALLFRLIHTDCMMQNKYYMNRSTKR